MSNSNCSLVAGAASAAAARKAVVRSLSSPVRCRVLPRRGHLRAGMRSLAPVRVVLVGVAVFLTTLNCCVVDQLFLEVERLRIWTLHRARRTNSVCGSPVGAVARLRSTCEGRGTREVYSKHHLLHKPSHAWKCSARKLCPVCRPVAWHQLLRFQGFGPRYHRTKKTCRVRSPLLWRKREPHTQHTSRACCHGGRLRAEGARCSRKRAVHPPWETGIPAPTASWAMSGVLLLSVWWVEGSGTASRASETLPRARGRRALSRR